MNIKEKMEKFNKRWNVVSTESYEESFQKFKTRILNIFEDIDEHVTRESITLFCQYCGIRETPHNFGIRDHSNNIINQLIKEGEEIKFYRLIEIIFFLEMYPANGSYVGYQEYSKGNLFKKVSEAIDLSNINLSIATLKGDIILYPKGEKSLDKELVDSPISFLDEKSTEHFIQALQFYQTKKFVKSADSLRRSLEEFLKFKLKNKKGLQANISELQKRLKNNGYNTQIRNIISQIFTYMDQYFNENCKHNDGEINEQENEFLIYQIGLLMRYINSNI